MFWLKIPPKLLYYSYSYHKEKILEKLFQTQNMTITLRSLRPDETELLKDFLYEAIFIPEGVQPPERKIIELPELKIYYEDFGSDPADFCLVAEDCGRVIGAVWTRIMNDYGHVDDETPSFAISLIPEYRNQGIGTRLMKEMLSLLKEHGFRQASLAVQKANYAVRMYKEVGFETIDENEEEFIMVCRL
jgi:ribosomal protein S18 acetylase RimI-like enzyme